jgi:hypothetical protein
VRASSLAGDSNAQILGCINAPNANTADLGAGKACPSVMPVAGDYTFFVVSVSRSTRRIDLINHHTMGGTHIQAIASTPTAIDLIVQSQTRLACLACSQA